MTKYLEIDGTKIELRILTEGFKNPDGPNACTSKCCRHGVYLDPTERDEILAHANILERFLDETQTTDRSKWFDNSAEVDSDFPSGECVSTQIYNDKCVFLNKNGHCVLQIAEMEEKMPRFSLKPYYCVLFPIVKLDGAFEYDDFCCGESDCCTASKEYSPKMVEACSIELEHAIGELKYKKLLEFYQTKFVNAKSQDALSQTFMEGELLDAGK